MKITISVENGNHSAVYNEGKISTTDNCPVELVEKLLSIAGTIGESTAQPKTEYELYRYAPDDDDVKCYHEGEYQGFISSNLFQRILDAKTSDGYIKPSNVYDSDAVYVVSALNSGATVQPAKKNPYY